MSGDFTDIMAKKSDSELLEIVTKLKDDYQPDAVMAAEKEIKKRNLSTTQIEQATIEIKEKEEKHLEKATEPLEIGQKILFLVFFWGIVPWAMAGTFKANGYTKKYKDAWKFMKIGIAIFIGILFILFIIFSMTM